MSKELIIGLLNLVNSGKKKSDIEKDLKMPTNSLSSILTGKKPFPPKWIQPVEKYLNGGVQPEPKPAETVMSIGKRTLDEWNARINYDENEKSIVEPWIEPLRVFCAERSLNLADLPSLITTLQDKLSAKDEEINSLNKQLGFEKSKTLALGLKKEERKEIQQKLGKPAYDPFKNSAFLSKMSVKASDKKENVE